MRSRVLFDRFASWRFASLAPLALVLLAPAAARAATWSVAPSGNDQSDGSPAHPFATIARAAAAVAPGDVVDVAAGTYAGFVVEAKDGTPSAPIVFRAQPGVRVTSVGPAPVIPPANHAVGGIDVLRSSWIVIDGFEVDGIPGDAAGILLENCRHVTVRGSRVDANGRWGIFSSFCDDLVIEGNEASRSGREHGIYLSNSGDRPIVRGNRAWGNARCGIQLNADNTWDSAEYRKWAVVDGTISGAVIAQNVVYDNGAGGGAAINLDGVNDSRIENNLLYGNHGWGIALFQEDGRTASQRDVVVNDTIVMAADGRAALQIVACDPANVSGATCTTADAPATASTGHFIANDVLVGGAAYPDVHVDAASLARDATSGVALTSDHDVVARFAIDATSLDLAAWRARTGLDAASLSAPIAALFTDAAAADYTLSATSPAIDRGTATNAPLVDLLGQPRPQGAGFDVGAYERPVAAPPSADAGGDAAIAPRADGGIDAAAPIVVGDASTPPPFGAGDASPAATGGSSEDAGSSSGGCDAAPARAGGSPRDLGAWALALLVAVAWRARRR